MVKIPILIVVLLFSVSGSGQVKHQFGVYSNAIFDMINPDSRGTIKDDYHVEVDFQSKLYGEVGCDYSIVTGNKFTFRVGASWKPKRIGYDYDASTAKVQIANIKRNITIHYGSLKISGSYLLGDKFSLEFSTGFYTPIGITPKPYALQGTKKKLLWWTCIQGRT